MSEKITEPMAQILIVFGLKKGKLSLSQVENILFKFGFNTGIKD